MTKDEAIRKVVNIARAQVGYTAASGKRNKYAEELDRLGFWNGPKNGFDWCTTFVAWAFTQAFGMDAAQTVLRLPPKSSGAGCVYWARFYRDQGAWSSDPQIGDQIFFGTFADEDHTGVVTDLTPQTVTTVEGNAGGGDGAVRVRNYPRTDGWITGYGRPLWTAVADGKAEDVKPTAPKQKIDEDGDFGALSTKAMQEWMKTEADGEISGQLKHLAGFYPAITSTTGGGYGSELIRTFQNYLKSRGFDPSGADGIIGRGTVTAWQRWLRDQQGFALDADGIFGPQSAKAMQHFLNVVLA